MVSLPASEPAESNGIVAVKEPSAPPTPRKPAATAVERLPIAPTPRTGRVVQQQAALLVQEQRDPDWAARSEAAILNQMRDIAYVGRGRFLEATCAASTCEVTGMADVDPATGSMAPVWEALERDTAGDALRRQGLERSAAVFDNGRNPEQFTIYYRRIPIAPAG